MNQQQVVLPFIPERKLTRKEAKAARARVKRFLALPPELQEGVLLYGENIQKAYSGVESGGKES